MERYCAALLASVFIFFSHVADAQGRRVALVIGNSAYKETAPLINTRNDAADVSAALKRLQFDVLDGVDLDKRAMERLIRQFDQKLAGADVALFFYAGHGIQVSGQNHLVPIDARLSAEGDLDFESLPLNLILRRMEREAKTSLILLDACRDNPLARNLSRTMGTRSANVGQGLAEVKTGVGTLISFSTQPGNVALDGDGRNSPYTGALLKQIESPGLDVLSMLAAVRGEVVRTTAGRQVPWEHTSLLGPLVLAAAPAAAASVPAAAMQLSQPSVPAAPPSPASRSSEAAEAWPLVKDSSSSAALEAFVRRFGDTFYGDLAKARLAELSKPKAPAPQPPASSAQSTPAPQASVTGSASTTAPAPPGPACSDVLPFLKNTGAFGAKPVQDVAYAERVTYYKRGAIARAELVAIAREYERKYPTRIYEVDEKSIQLRAEPSVNGCYIKFEYTYIARNNAEERSGRGASEFTVRRAGNRFEIVQETGDILTRAVRQLR